MGESPVQCVACLLDAASRLSEKVAAIQLDQSVPWIYNPLEYAWQAHQAYVERFAKPSCRSIFLGMNPGPWGMAQTGVPFGEINVVRNWLGIRASIGRPAREHPRRPILGLDCQRSEVSGRRLWGLFQERFDSPDSFFSEHFVANYCPLVFMEESGRNLTPDKLPVADRKRLETACDAHLVEMIRGLKPDWLVGVGAFAETSARRAIAGAGIEGVQVGRILHPSPASPAANRDWAGTATGQLIELGIWD